MAPATATSNPATEKPTRTRRWIALSPWMFVAVLVLSGLVGCGGPNPGMNPMPQSEAIAVYPIDASEPVCLVEMRFRGLDGFFNVGEITQEIPGEPRANWQVPYMERILNSAGDSVLADDSVAATRPDLWKGEVRMVFFFHYLDLKRPLKTPFGDVRLPAKTKLPDRLSMIQYEPP